jgi:hypothetical protein
MKWDLGKCEGTGDDFLVMDYAVSNESIYSSGRLEDFGAKPTTLVRVRDGAQPLDVNCMWLPASALSITDSLPGCTFLSHLARSLIFTLCSVMIELLR